jgi:hypothetical protein
MFFLRLTLCTCALYLVFALPFILVEIAAEFATKSGTFGYQLSRENRNRGVCRVLGNNLAAILFARISRSIPLNLEEIHSLTRPASIIPT